jgi:FecR protein
MRYARPRWLLFLILILFLTVSSFSIAAKSMTIGSASEFSPDTPKPSASAQAQIVRLSYVRGAVKISTGLNGSPSLGNEWAAAGVNFPIEEGVTLATEQGRAEVEFENGSMVYLAENSVLQFRQLTTVQNGTVTKVFLLVGRATFALESNGHNDFTIKTPVALLHLNSAKTLRVESALDGAIFRVVDGHFQFSGRTAGETFSVGPGDAFQCVNSVLSPLPDLLDDPDQVAWDQWVNEERLARKADLEMALQQSGLVAPIPGLVDLVRGGKFTDCPPFGKCWEPNQPEIPSGALPTPAPAPQPQNPTLSGKAAQKCDVTQNPGVYCAWTRAEEGASTVYQGPCGRGPRAERHYWVDKLILYTPQDPQGQVVDERWGIDFWDYGPGIVPASHPGWWRFPWATCHAGSWIPERPERIGCKPEKGGKSGKCPPPPKRWVVGSKRKSGSFVRVRMGKAEGFIPKHPLDTKGKPPLNADDGVLTFHGKGAQEIEQIKPRPKNLQIVKSLPAGYEATWAKNLPKVEKPVIEGSLLQSRAGLANQEIRFDYKTRNFIASSKIPEGPGEHTRSVVIAHLGSSRANSSASHTTNGNTLGGGSPRNGGGEASSSRNSSHGNSGTGASSSSRWSSSSTRTSSQPSSGAGGGEGRTVSPAISAPPTPAPTPAPSSTRH